MPAVTINQPPASPGQGVPIQASGSYTVEGGTTLTGMAYQINAGSMKPMPNINTTNQT